jgi:hypothetical protein
LSDDWKIFQTGWTDGSRIFKRDGADKTLGRENKIEDGMENMSLGVKHERNIAKKEKIFNKKQLQARITVLCVGKPVFNNNPPLMISPIFPIIYHMIAFRHRSMRETRVVKSFSNMF